MKHLLIIAFVALFTCKASAQDDKIVRRDSKNADSVEVRIYNNTHYYLKTYKIILGTQSFTFNDINKHEYSSYKLFPYWPDTYGREVTFVRKRLLQYHEWINLLSVPVDFVGDRELTSGQITIKIRLKKIDGKWTVESDLVRM